jgi:ADP-ribose pyrophosphatase
MSTGEEHHGPEEIVGQGKFIRLLRHDGWEYVERQGISGIVIVVAVTDDGQAVLVEQYRRPLKRRVIEWPAGLVGDLPGIENEDFTEAARRELMEEAGYSARSMHFLLRSPTSPGQSKDFYTFYRASGLEKVQDGGGDHTEKIRVHTVPLAEVDTWLHARSGEGFLIDQKVYVGLYFIRHPDASG